MSRPINIPAVTVEAIDQMDKALDKLRTVHLGLAPEAAGDLDDRALTAVWATIGSIIADLKPVREALNTEIGDMREEAMKLLAKLPPKKAAKPTVPDGATADRHLVNLESELMDARNHARVLFRLLHDQFSPVAKDGYYHLGEDVGETVYFAASVALKANDDLVEKWEQAVIAAKGGAV